MIELLLSLILAMTGIARDVDPELTAIAQQRAVEASADFSHTGQVSWTAEVLAWNERELEPATRRAAEQWRDSPPHWAILTDRNLTRIGCGHHQVGSRHTFACVLAYPAAPAAEPVEVARTPNPTPVGSTPTSGATPTPAPTSVPMMPDTSMTP